MKAKLTLSIAATLALLLFCVVVTVNSPRSLAGEALGIDLPRPVETQWSDDHGGFLGDGVTRGVLVFSSQNGAALEKALAEHEAWHTLPLPEPVNRNLFDAAEAKGLGLETLPATLEEAVQVAEESEFLRRVLPEGLSKRYFSEELKRCAALRSAPDRAEHERVYYFNAI